jgi:hypothetical protein
MALDIRQFFQATNPSKTLVKGNPEDEKYYIDFSDVRGGELITELKESISFFSPEDPTCTLFTGHIGCGKSTELLRLKAELERDGFHVVYFASSDDLEMGDVDVGDVLLVIARRIMQSLDQTYFDQTHTLQELLQGAARLLMTEIELQEFELGMPKVDGLPEAKLSAKKSGEFSLAFGIGKITAKAKSSSVLREKLNQYLGPQKARLLEAINKEVLLPAIAKLKTLNRLGLVVIVDNLDRIEPRQKSWGRSQQEYLFIDQSDFLTRLRCHVVYTMPLDLRFSSEYGIMTQRFPDEPKVLPMVPVQFQDGSECTAGMTLLRQMVLARALPDLSPEARLQHISSLFDPPESLDRLCHASGGHVRDLLKLLNDWIKKNRQFPLKQDFLEQVIRSRRNDIVLSISDDEWELLRQVRQRKKINEAYQSLIRSRLVYEYRDRGESWFDVNPLLLGAKELAESP